PEAQTVTSGSSSARRENEPRTLISEWLSGSFEEFDVRRYREKSRASQFFSLPEDATSAAALKLDNCWGHIWWPGCFLWILAP
ncbi:hypothetical protein DNTS_033321, partial [Danionella cerebrum]